MSKRDSFSSKFGVIAAAAGSAIGLGNIWRFPYVLGENGGGAFFLIYLFFIVSIGIPVMLSELVIGRRSQSSIFGAFKVLCPGVSFFQVVGVMGVAAAFLILSFYSVVAGWTVEYTVLAIGNQLSDKTPEQLSVLFQDFSTSLWRPIFYLVVFMFLTAGIVIGGVKNGIERYAKILMPVLFLIIIILCVKSASLSGAVEGFKFLFQPDFSKITGNVVLEALGQAFFSLSIGMGAIATYGSYVQKKENLVHAAVSVSMVDTLIAVLAGVAIFPAVFAFNIQPDAGPGLVFVTLPNIFNQMGGGYFFSVAFFVLLLIAALTSSVSLLEVVVAYFTDELKMSRKYATLLGTILMIVLGVFCVIYPKLFDAFEWTSSNLLLPLGGILISVFIGWFLGKDKVKEEIEAHGGKVVILNVFMVIVKIFAPIAVALVFMKNIGLLG
ncbi:sodium-dependent transporter [Saccharicrinis fermentans]|uniref:Transporter n=1 Tax=Saccharicrinis fermentans DSM 9555 = JCM 21142 TaxID=869213 RepID=W7Y685_9BACT|nr:sodium-dependent transporter [Saccharicrinis fermentans]GAF03123.1 Na(+)-dependent transporters [Saccharicrinis fermentans DSM 9555 = JCM 21142]